MPDDVLPVYLRELRGERLLYRPNPGNAGDALIAAATINLFGHLGLQFELVGDPVPDVRDRIVIHGGGGGFWDCNPVVAGFLERHAAARRLILLPQTITGHAALLESLPQHVHLFCRDRVSFDYLAGLRLRARVFLDHDVALRLPAREWLARHGWLRLFLASPGRCFKGARRFQAAARAHPDRRELRVWRGDAESARPDMPRAPRHADLSRAFALGLRRKGFINVSAACLLRFVARYESVTTDRLHVAIAGALLGRNVTLAANRYFKNRAVYEHSLRERFPHLRWAAEEGLGFALGPDFKS